MIYNDFGDIKLSALGMGCMRLPVVDGDDSTINESLVSEMVDYAIENGINYFDTAWGYHGGNSEIVIGKLLTKYPREDYYLADKFPGYDLSNMNKVDEIFEQQLQKCDIDYFDFYLFHNVCELNIDAYLDEKYGIFDYLKKQKENGRIRHLGFSVHGSLEVMERFLDAYGDHMEFGQIQLNYLDWTLQDAKRKVELLNEYQIPIWVMEPMRGGRLALLPDKDIARLKALRSDDDVPTWAFRFLQSIPGVKLTLTGASNFEQLKANIKSFEADMPLNTHEMDTLLSIADGMLKSNIMPCTACRYCVSHCPNKLDIPFLLELYNEHSFSGGGFIVPMALAAIPEEKQPKVCSSCRNCEAVCPQQLKISEAMSVLSNI